MKMLICCALFMSLFSFPTLATLEPRHMVSVNPSGLGWSGSYERLSTTDSSAFKTAHTFLHNFALNYAYRFTKRWQLGAFFQQMTNRSEFVLRSGGTAPLETNSTVIGTFLLYNFSDDLFSSWYTGASLSGFNQIEENSHKFNTAEGKAPMELDDSGVSFELVLGKRFSLKAQGLSNITFAPQAGVFTRTHHKDFKDQGTRNGLGLSLFPIKFDILF